MKFGVRCSTYCARDASGVRCLTTFQASLTDKARALEQALKSGWRDPCQTGAQRLTRHSRSQ